MVQMVKNPPAMGETWVWSLVWEDPLEEGILTHSSILAWRIPVDREAQGRRVRHDWATKHSTAPNIKFTILAFFKCTVQS